MRMARIAFPLTGRSDRLAALKGALVTHLIFSNDPWSVVRIQLGVEGVLGMHAAANDQLFIVCRGSGVACTMDSEPLPIDEGSLLFWRAGEWHETRAGKEGLEAIVVEGAALG